MPTKARYLADLLNASGELDSTGAIEAIQDQISSLFAAGSHTGISFSYNDSSLVDPILLDRLKEINVNPYSLKDKIEIVNNFIIPELINSIGLQDIKINITNDIIEYLIENYTQEAGVREIKRVLVELTNLIPDSEKSKVKFSGPLKVFPERLSKKYRSRILLEADERADLHRTLNIIKATITKTRANTIIDVDPIDF